MRGAGTVYKRCGCRDPRTRRQLGTRRGRLKNRGHGSWYIALPHVPTENDPRARIRRGGYPSRVAAEQAIARLTPLRQADARPLTVSQWLQHWLDRAEEHLRATSINGYRQHIHHYLTPMLGYELLTELAKSRVQDAFDALIRKRHREGDPVTPATLHRIASTLSSALTWAIRDGLIQNNPAQHLHLPQAEQVRPVVWTSKRVDHWRATGERPPLAEWTVDQTATFLTEIRGHRAHVLFHLYALLGLRRGEGIALYWDDIDLDERTLTVRRQFQLRDGAVRACPPKTWTALRTIYLDPNTAEILRTHRDQQQREQAAAERAWTDSRLVFTTPTGRPLRPDHATRTFRTLLRDLDLPPVRLHDLRSPGLLCDLEVGRSCPSRMVALALAEAFAMDEAERERLLAAAVTDAGLDHPLRRSA